LQFIRFNEVRQALEKAIFEMKQCAREMRKLSSDHQIRDFRPIHVHIAVLCNACFMYDQIAEKLKSLTEELVEPWTGASPPSEVQEYASYNINDPG
jgi:hypothetical protein